MFARLGARIAFLGIDARTERTRHQVNYPDTYDAIFTRLKHELADAASDGRPIRHLILLLGIPIAYPVSSASAPGSDSDDLLTNSPASHMARKHLLEPPHGSHQAA